MGFLSKLLRRDSEDALSVPAMDGVFKPNTLLDSAETVLGLPGIDNLVVVADGLCCSSGNGVHAVRMQDSAKPIANFAGPVTMMAASPSGRRHRQWRWSGRTTIASMAKGLAACAARNAARRSSMRSTSKVRRRSSRFTVKK